MDLTNINDVWELLAEFEIKPDKNLGQNFLLSPEPLTEMILAAGIKPNDAVLEVGPGLGVLTERLANITSNLFCCELDKRMTKVLGHTIASRFKKVKIYQGDILSKDFYQEFTTWLTKNKLASYKIVSNLPYQITSFFLRTFLNYHPKPESLTLLIQKEVAERIVALPGEMNLLAISVQFYSFPKIVLEVGKENFYPQPKVDSAVIHLNARAGFYVDHPEIIPKKFFALVRSGFSAKRKVLINNLSSGLKLNKEELEKFFLKIGLNLKVRAQDLSLDNWLSIYQTFCL